LEANYYVHWETNFTGVRKSSSGIKNVSRIFIIIGEGSLMSVTIVSVVSFEMVYLQFAETSKRVCIEFNR
jgi:hypothetical protein